MNTDKSPSGDKNQTDEVESSPLNPASPQKSSSASQYLRGGTARLKLGQYAATKFFIRHITSFTFGFLALASLYATKEDIVDAVARHQVVKARAFMREDDYADALACTDIALKLNPAISEAHQTRGKVFFKIDQWSNALSEYELVLLDDPKNLEVLDRIASVCIKLGQYQQALEYYDTIFSLKAPNIPPYMYANRAVAYSMTGDYPRAIEDYEASLREQPNDVTCLMGDAFCKSRIGKYVEAISHCDGVLATSPENVDALLLKGWCQQMLKQYPFALANYKKAEALEPKNPRPLTYQAELCQAQKQEEKALQMYSAIIALYPEFGKAHQARAAILARRGKLEQAIKDYEAMEADPASLTPEYYSTLAGAYIKTNRFSESLKMCNAGLKKMPGNIELERMRAKCEYQTKNYASALADCNAILKKKPHDSDALTQRGMCNVQLGNGVSALNDYCAAISASNRNALAYLVRGDFYLQNRQYDSAATDYKHALALQPTNSEARSKFQEVSAISQKQSVVTLDLPKAATSKYTKAALAKLDNKSLLEKGYLLLETGEPIDAIAVLSESVRRSPNDQRARRYLARALGDGNHAEQAIAQFNTLSSLRATTVQDKLDEAHLRNSHGDHARAIEMYEAMLSADPKNDQAILGLAQALSSSNQTDKAIVVCNDAMNSGRSGPVMNKVRNLCQSLLQQKLREAQPKQQHKGPSVDMGG